jgi:aspartyl-tRNA(Asn)/glutamyl-tRNA(Gln) amidotransferase subunit C
VKITDSQVLHVAGLARLKLDSSEVERFQRELNSILAYMEMLSEVDTADAAPLHHTFPMTNVFRPDAAKESQDISDALGNAPQHEDGFIVVPKVIE